MAPPPSGAALGLAPVAADALHAAAPVPRLGPARARPRPCPESSCRLLPPTPPSAPPPRGLHGNELHPRRNRRAAASDDSSPFNPVIVLRLSAVIPGAASSYELFYDDGAASGICLLPESMSDSLMGSGFECLLGQLAQIDVGGFDTIRPCENPPASKAAVESMPCD